MPAVITTCWRRWIMRDVVAELKSLRLHGMASAYEELSGQGGAVIQTS